MNRPSHKSRALSPRGRCLTTGHQNTGIDRAKLDALLLQKVEKLHLYVLQLQKQNEEQQTLIGKLVKKNRNE